MYNKRQHLSPFTDYWFFFIIMSYPYVNNNSLNRKMLIQEYDKLSKILQLRERQEDKFQDGKMAS
jgi:hypothetical protein